MTRNAKTPSHPFYEIKSMVGGVPTSYQNHKGMTKREECAMRAMQGLLANPGGPVQSSQMSGFNFCNCDASDIAKLSVSLADALLAELDK